MWTPPLMLQQSVLGKRNVATDNKKKNIFIFTFFFTLFLLVFTFPLCWKKMYFPLFFEHDFGFDTNTFLTIYYFVGEISLNVFRVVWLPNISLKTRKCAEKCIGFSLVSRWSCWTRLLVLCSDRKFLLFLYKN